MSTSLRLLPVLGAPRSSAILSASRAFLARRRSRRRSRQSRSVAATVESFGSTVGLGTTVRLECRVAKRSGTRCHRPLPRVPAPRLVAGERRANRTVDMSPAPGPARLARALGLGQPAHSHWPAGMKLKRLGLYRFRPRGRLMGPAPSHTSIGGPPQAAGGPQEAGPQPALRRSFVPTARTRRTCRFGLCVDLETVRVGDPSWTQAQARSRGEQRGAHLGPIDEGRAVPIAGAARVSICKADPTAPVGAVDPAAGNSPTPARIMPLNRGCVPARADGARCRALPTR